MWESSESMALIIDEIEHLREYVDEEKDIVNERLDSQQKMLMKLEINPPSQRNRQEQYAGAKNRSDSILNMNPKFDIADVAPDGTDDDLNKLPGDIYSFFASTNYTDGCKPKTSFSLAISIFAIQTLTLSLFFVDIFDISDKDNPLGIPAGVDNVVRMAQLIALLITAVSQDETQLSLNLLARGYDAQAINMFQGKITASKWYFSLFTRFAIGALSLVVTFMLIIRSDTVRDLMLDFTAVSFVSQIDNAGFLLSNWGYFGRQVRFESEEIQNLSVHVKEKDLTTTGTRHAISLKRRKIPRVLSLTLILIGMVLAWLFLTIKQLDGAYIDTTIFVQFGDEFLPALGTFSGLYELKTGSLLAGGRDAEYVAIGSASSEGRMARFAFCNSEDAWVFSFGEDPVSKNPLTGTCDYIAKSTTTRDFDITSTSLNSWFFFNHATGEELPLQQFVIKGHNEYYGKACSIDTDCGDILVCNTPFGEFEKQCVCEDGRLGYACEFLKPCLRMEIDTNVVGTPGFDSNRAWSDVYNSVSISNDPDETPILVYGKPVFIGASRLIVGVFDVMVFTGRRWALMQSDKMDDLPDTVTTPEGLAQFLSENFHAYWSAYPLAFISDPDDVGTPSNAASPTNLAWGRIESDADWRISFLTRASAALLFCIACDDEVNPCFYEGECITETQTCVCQGGAYGSICQIAPISDSFCDTYFNEFDFTFDGGDCCQGTCVSNGDGSAICGVERTTSVIDLTTEQFRGFPDCVNNGELCERTNATVDCWREVDKVTSVRTSASLGHSVSISGNGAIMATVSYNVGEVKIFEVQGSSALLRGTPFVKTQVSCLDLSYDGSVVAMGSENGGAYVFIWMTNNRVWKRLGAALEVSKPVTSISLSDDGTALAVSYKYIVDLDSEYADIYELGVTKHYTQIYEFDPFGQHWNEVRRVPYFFEGQDPDRSMFVTLTGPGNALVIGIPTSNTTGSTYNGALTAYVKKTCVAGSVSYTCWEEMGERVEDRTTSGEEYGRYNDMSSEGTRLLTVFSSERFKRRIVAYEFNPDEGDGVWAQLGQDIAAIDLTEFSSEEGGISVSMSADGTKVLVGTPGEASVTGAVATMYEYSEATNWTAVWRVDAGETAESSFVPSVSMSHLGDKVVVGNFEKINGETVFYRDLAYATTEIRSSSFQPFSEEDEGIVALHFSIQLDGAPEDTGVFLHCGNYTIFSLLHGQFVVPYELGEATVFVPKEIECVFTIADSSINGIEGGTYEIYYGEKAPANLLVLGASSFFGSIEKTTFNAAPPPAGLFPVIMELQFSGLDEPEGVGVNLLCDGVIATTATPGAFAEKGSTFDVSGTFMLQNGTNCQLMITQTLSTAGECETCSLTYEVRHAELNNIIIAQNISSWTGTPNHGVTFTVVDEPNEVVPVTVTYQADISRDIFTTIRMACDGDYALEYVNTLFLQNENVLEETLYVPSGSMCLLTFIDELIPLADACCGSRGSYQVIFGDSLDGSIIFDGRKLDTRESLYFEATEPSSKKSPLSILIQFDEWYEETSFQLNCSNAKNEAIMSYWFIAELDELLEEYRRVNHVFLVEDIEGCSLGFHDAYGDGLPGGYFDVSTEGEPILYHADFRDTKFELYDLGKPPELVPISVLYLPAVSDDPIFYELRCGDAVEQGSVSDASRKTMFVIDQAYCQFTVEDPNGEVKDGSAAFQLHYGLVDFSSTTLIYEGSSITFSETVIFHAVQPSAGLVPLNYIFERDGTGGEWAEVICADVRYYTSARPVGRDEMPIAKQTVLLPGVEDCELTTDDCCGGLFQMYLGTQLIAQNQRGTGPWDEIVFNIADLKYLSRNMTVAVDAPVISDFRLIVECGPLFRFDSDNVQLSGWETSARGIMAQTALILGDTECTVLETESIDGSYEIFRGGITDSGSALGSLTAPENILNSGGGIVAGLAYFDILFDDVVVVPVSINFLLDTFPGDVGGSIDCSGTTADVSHAFAVADILSQTPSLNSEAFNVTFAIPSGSSCVLTITDSYGDGIRQGGYNVFVGDVKVASEDGEYTEVQYDLIVP